MRIRNVIWDFDGTLFDTDPAIVDAFDAVLRSRYGIDVNRDRLWQLSKVDTKHCAQVIAGEYALDAALLRAQARAAYDAMDITLQKPFDGAQACCEKVLTSGGSNIIITHRDKASSWRFLDHYGFTDYFSQVITIDDGFALKPSPASFLHAITANKLEPAATCGIGDRDIDVGAASAAGLHAVFFCPLGTTHSHAHRSIRALRELEAIL